MRLGDFFKGQSTQISGSAQTAQTQTATPAKTALVNQQIRALAPGQTLQGEVVSKNGGEVQIKVSDDFTLNARLDQNVNIEVGKNLTFEVKNNGSALTLSPLFTNTATDANIMKALDMASMPVNEVTVNMTEQMMSAGLSIDKNSLQQMFREVNAYPQATSADLVNLHKLAMPVNENNVNQMVSYRNLTHQLISGMTDVLSELPEVFSNLLSSGDVEGAVSLYQSLTELAEEADVARAMPEDMSDMVEEGVHGEASAAAGEGALETTAELMEDIALPAGEAETADAAAGDGRMPGANVGLSGMSDDMPAAKLQDAQGRATVIQTRVIAEGEESLQQSVRTEEGAEATAHAQNTNIAGGEDAGSKPAANVEGEVFRATVDAGQGAEQELTALTAQNAPEVMEKLAQGGRDVQMLKNLLEPLTKQLLEKWTLEPSDVEDAKEIENLYNRLNSQLKGLTQALEKGGQTDTAAYKAVTNMSQNLDFMNQVNQMYAYVQLPLRLQQGNAHGDLYVYTNKKNLAMKDGQISALLHLDMEHLGPVDVYVAMQSDNVNTRFYVQDDSMLDFLEEHMDILTQRLQKRGYNCSLAMQVRGAKQEENGIDQMLEQDNSIPLVEYAFDVRT